MRRVKKMNIIKDTLLQITFIAIPMFTFHTLFSGRFKNDKQEKLAKTVLWGISLILCISFPASFGQGYRWDIRTIPLLLGTLYCGTKTGIFLSSILIVYRLYMGIDTAGFINAVLALLCGVPVFMYFQKTFIRATKEKKIRIAVLLSLYYACMGIAWFNLLRPFSLDTFKTQMMQLVLVVLFTGLFTVLNEMIREIHQLRLEVQKADKLHVVSDLTSVFAHEIRNPMQVTRGFLQLLNEPDLPEKKKGYIQMSIEELDRANEIINDLLSFGKPETNHDEKVEVGYQIRRVINIVQPYAFNHYVAIKTNIHNDCCIYGNSQKLYQCLVNMLKNAIESMPSGGNVYVSCFSNQDREIEIQIEDQGIGMTKDEIERLGSPYYSLKESGTGLGMMVSFQIIRSFKGKVEVTSKKGNGTKFSIFLPREQFMQEKIHIVNHDNALF
jgi:two-component system sporulation sensor kinase B